MNSVISIVAFVLAYILFRYLGIVGLIFLAAYYLGDWLAKWYCNRNKINIKLLDVASRLNVITWLLPPLGVFTASLAYGFSVQVKNKSNKSYRKLAIVGAVLSILN